MVDDDLKALWKRAGREATMSYAEIEPGARVGVCRKTAQRLDLRALRRDGAALSECADFSSEPNFTRDEPVSLREIIPP